MSLIINHNLSALNTQRNLSGSGASMAKSIEKLSSGYKINVGGDDPSGLIISEQLRSQISGLERAVRNSSEAFNLIGIAEGALNEMNTILKKMRALAIHAANSGVTSPEQVAADQSEMDSGIETLNRIANTTRYSDQYLLNGQKQLVYDVTTAVNEPTDHALLDTKMTRIDQVFKRDGVKMSIGFAGEDSQYKANTDTSAQRAYLEADNAFSLCEIDGTTVTANQEFILTGTSGSRLFSFQQGAHVGTIVDAINNVRDSTGIGAALTFASDVRIDKTTNGTPGGQMPTYPNKPADMMTGYDDGTYIYQNGDVQIYGAGLNNVDTAKISEFSMTPDAAASFKVGYNTDGDGKIYAKVVDKSTNSIEYYKDKECTMLIGMGDNGFFAATNNSGIPSSPVQNLDGIFLKLNSDNAQDLDVFEIGVIGQRLDNQKDMNVTLAGWTDTDNSVMSGVNLGVNTDPEGSLYYSYVPEQFEADGKTVKTFRINVYKHPSQEPKYLVATSGTVENNIKVADPNATPPQLAGQTVRVESVLMDNGVDSGLNITLNLPKKGDLDELTGMTTIDDIKATPEYQELMKQLSTARGAYSQISDSYTDAKKIRDDARGELDKALEALQRTRDEEARVRREIDRLEARDIDEQIADATRDLDLSQNDMVAASRKAIEDPDLDRQYTDAQENAPGSPEVIAEQMAQRILDEITNTLPADPVTGVLWDDPATKSKMMQDVWDRAPLVTITDGMTAAEKITITDSVNDLLSAAYDAATDPIDMIKDVADKTKTLDGLSTLQVDYDAAKLALQQEKDYKFDYVIEEALNALGNEWLTDMGGAANSGGNIKLAANDLWTEIKQQLADAQTADPAGFSKFNFNAGWWGEQKADIIDDTITKLTANGGINPALVAGNAAEDTYRAVLTDMYDTLMSTNATEINTYTGAMQDLADNPAPAYAADYQNEVLQALQAATSTNVALGSLVAPVPDADMVAIDTELAGAGFSAGSAGWNELAAEIAADIDTVLNSGVTPYPYAAADFAAGGTLFADVMTAIGGHITGANVSDTTKLGDLIVALDAAALPARTTTAGVAGPELTDLVTQIWNDAIAATTSSANAYGVAMVKNENAVNALNAADVAMGTGMNAADPLGALALDAINSVNFLDTGTNTVSPGNPGVAAPAAIPAANKLGPLGQAVADAFAEQLDLLAAEGIDITDPAKITGTVKNQIVNALIDAANANGMNASGTSPVDEATLKQYMSELVDTYVDSQTPNETAVAGSGTKLANAGAVPPLNAGLFDSYTETSVTYADLAAIYPGGGKIQRATDRLDRYGDRIETLPLQKAENSATTRDLWTDLEDLYPGIADRDLTNIAEDFGKYVRTLVENATKAGTENKISWNDGSVYDAVNEVRDWLDNNAKVGPNGTLWTRIQQDKNAAGPGAAAANARGEAAEESFNKIVEKMFEAVTKPDYNADVSDPDAADTAGAVAGYEFRSPVQRYFDQYETLQDLQNQYDEAVNLKENLDDAIGDLIDLTDGIPDVGPGGEILGDLVQDLHDASEEVGFIAQDAEPLLDDIARIDAEAKAMLVNAKSAREAMPPGNQTGSVEFTNLGLRVFSVDYGSAETIRIQNKAGNLFYQYREPDSMEKLMVEPDKTVQVAGQDAQISLNGAPIFTTGLVADTTTPDFSGSLVFNAGTLGETSLAVAGYDVGKLFSKATALQGVEENEPEIAELRRSFEPPAMSVKMGDADNELGMLGETGSAVNLYMDFSQLDPSVEVKIDNLGQSCKINVSFTAPDQLTIDASALGTDSENQMKITVPVNPGNLETGYYVTDPALKGLFIRTDVLVNLNMSGDDYAPPRAEIPATTPSGGSAMLEVNTYATNPRKSTNESMENFIGGMQFQLGNTEGDQDRTIYSIPSMAMSELGRISWNGQEYCLQNVLGGGLASLTKDPILAMRVLEQAVDDVSTLRARLGAFQSNMLQSNINSLGVAIENITKTESAIRDTDMAAESTEFTRFQIMQQAGTSMLAQANQTSQNVLSLLQ